MVRENNIKRKRAGWISWVVTGVGLALLAYFGVAIARQQPRLSVLRHELKRTNEQLSEVAAEKTKLNTRKDYYQSNAYLERQARLKLNYKKPGEEVVYVYHAPNPPGPPYDKGGGTLAKPASNLRQWITYLLRE